MFFGKNQTGFGNQPAVNMVNQPGMDGMQPEMIIDGMQGPGMMDGGMPCEGFEQVVAPDAMCAPQGQMNLWECGPCPEQPQAEPQVYVVQKGDSVYKIAQRYGLDWRELAAYNHLANPDLIFPGERLFIPSR